jgi:hypothetical protein
MDLDKAKKKLEVRTLNALEVTSGAAEDVDAS